MQSNHTFPATTGRSPDRVLLFDMDGVILEGPGLDPATTARALESALETFDVDPSRFPDSVKRSTAYSEAFREACSAAGIDPVTCYARRERACATAEIERIRSGERSIFPDTRVLSDLAGEYDLGLVSNNYDPLVSAVVEAFQLDAFAYTRGRDLGVDGYCRRKPDPHYLEEALDALERTHGIYVGDRETDIVAAERAGLEPVFIRRPENETASLDLDIETAHEIDSLEALPDVL